MDVKIGPEYVAFYATIEMALYFFRWIGGLSEMYFIMKLNADTISNRYGNWFEAQNELCPFNPLIPLAPLINHLKCTILANDNFWSREIEHELASVIVSKNHDILTTQ